MDLTATLHRALHRVTKLEDEAMAELGITKRQVMILRFFSAHEGASQTRAVAETGMDRSTLADVTRRLIDKGLLARKRTRHDARMYAVGITARGASTLAEADIILARVQREAFPATVQRHLPGMLVSIGFRDNNDAPTSTPLAAQSSDDSVNAGPPARLLQPLERVPVRQPPRRERMASELVARIVGDPRRGRERKIRRTMIEPFYIRQTAEAEALADPTAWANACTREAKERGAKHVRVSITDDQQALLFEAWDKTPREVTEAGGEGDQRWSLTASCTISARK